ncbi:citryl-CoA lyase [Planktomarina temperata]|nr:citryl-CoA lyase [Planktomarina temperata]
MLRTDIAWSTEKRIVVRGYDLPTEIIGKMNLGDFAFLELAGRKPSESESAVFNALAVTLVEHGLTPSALAARLTILGAPEALQGAVAAGLLGLGTTFAGTMEGAARFLQDSLRGASDDADLDAMAEQIVADHRAQGKHIPGLGHNLHKSGDPRTPALFAIADSHGVSGQHVALMKKVETAASEAFNRHLPINATGAIGAIGSELGLEWSVMRGVAVMARSIGLVAHLLEESKQPSLVKEMWLRTEAEATEHMREE